MILVPESADNMNQVPELGPLNTCFMATMCTDSASLNRTVSPLSRLLTLGAEGSQSAEDSKVKSKGLNHCVQPDWGVRGYLYRRIR
jgi:hypothetical protein